jgi:uncharacterized protein with NAD-binding domain and iron-sulfur cluster
MTTPKKIVIVGAGPSGLATAFALTDQEGWQDRYSIDVYQLGWRVGGKCVDGLEHAAHHTLHRRPRQLLDRVFHVQPLLE